MITYTGLEIVLNCLLKGMVFSQSASVNNLNKVLNKVCTSATSTPLRFELFSNYLFVECVLLCECLCAMADWRLRTLAGVSPFSLWVLGIKLRLLALSIIAFSQLGHCTGPHMHSIFKSPRLGKKASTVCPMIHSAIEDSSKAEWKEAQYFYYMA